MNKKFIKSYFQIGIAMSPRKNAFGPLMFSGHLENGICQLAKNNFYFVELSLRKINDIGTEDIVALLNHHKIKVSALATGQACLFDNLCLSNKDDESRQKAIEHFISMIELAVELQAGAVIIGGIRGKLTGSKPEQETQFQLGIDSIRQCAEFAQKKGMELLIEMINRYEMNWINTVSEGLQALELIKLPNLKLLLDTFHMNIEEANSVEAIRLAGDHLGYIHFADNTRHAPGQGQIDFSSILQVLDEINFSGPIISEILPIPDDLTALRNTADFWKKRGYLA